MRKIETISSHSGVARWLAGVATTRKTVDAALLPRTPFAYNAGRQLVYRLEDGRYVSLVETRHRHFEVWDVTDVVTE